MAQMMLVNPRRRRRKTSKKRKSPVRRRRSTTLARARRTSPARRRRRNPIKMNIGSMMKNTVMPSVTAAGGAVAVDVLLGYMPLPDRLKTGPARYLVKGVAAVGMGMLAANFVKPKTAEAFASGAMTVAVYGAMKDAVSRFAPGVAMGEYDDWSTGDLGYMSPGLVVDEPMGYYPGEAEGMGAYDENDFEL